RGLPRLRRAEKDERLAHAHVEGNVFEHARLLETLAQAPHARRHLDRRGRGLRAAGVRHAVIARGLRVATLARLVRGLCRRHRRPPSHLASSQSRAKKSVKKIRNEKRASTIATAFAASTCPSLNLAKM